MSEQTQIVISASRRTDIPAFYLRWFMAQVERDYFKVINPYNRQVTIVPATPQKVHTIVFWSKNFGPFLKKRIGEQLQKKGYNLFFNFTINTDNPLLEPNVPALTDRLKQVKALCSRFDPRVIAWRFDPICFYKNNRSAIKNNFLDFSRIVATVARSGITRCITSFMDDYPKIKKRTTALPGFSFVDPSLERKLEILQKMEKELLAKNIGLYTCCEKELLEALPRQAAVRKSSCIPNRLLMKIYGGKLSLKKDSGQRIKNGCGCMHSVDIGSYHLHPCYHNCLFCYANPATDFKLYSSQRR
jgi:DNA repair photolyase